MTNEITAEEAKSILETMHYQLSNQLGSDWCRNKYKAIGKAIEALDQVSHLNNRPCEACEYHKETRCVKWECVFKR